MAVFTRRPNGAPTKAVTIRIDPRIIERVEQFAKRETVTATLAFEEIISRGLSTLESDADESEGESNAEETEAQT